MAIRCARGEYQWGVSRNSYDTPSDPIEQAGLNPELLWSYVECMDLIVAVKVIAGRRDETFADTLNWNVEDPVWNHVRGLCPILVVTSKTVVAMFNHWGVIREHRSKYLSNDNNFL